jgi:hypothetical protein
MRTCISITIGIAVVIFFVHYTVEAQTLTILGTAPTLTITTGTSRTQPVNAVNTGCRLRYRQNISNPWKITVQTNLVNPQFTLSVYASNVGRGTAAGTVILDDTNAHDFITGITRSTTNATATINYVASALYSQGNAVEFGTDVHRVTYTLTP